MDSDDGSMLFIDGVMLINHTGRLPRTRARAVSIEFTCVACILRAFACLLLWQLWAWPATSVCDCVVQESITLMGTFLDQLC